MFKFIKKNNQKLTTGDHSTAIQGESIQIVEGIPAEKALAFILNLFLDNFPKLQETAAKKATERAEEITKSFLSRIYKTGSDKIGFLSDPDAQYVFFEALKGYSRSGNQVHFNLLVDLLLKRSELNSTDFLKILVDESIITIPKLAPLHFDMLSIIFLIKHTSMGIPKEKKELLLKHDFDKVSSNFIEFFRELVFPLSSKISFTDLDLSHLSYSGCGEFSSAVTYPFREIVDALNSEFVEYLITHYMISMKPIPLNKKRPDRERILLISLVEADQQFNAFNNIWDGDESIESRKLNQIELSSIGKVIGFANLKKIYGAEKLRHYNIKLDENFDLDDII